MPVHFLPDAKMYTQALAPYSAPLSALHDASSTRLSFVESLSGPMDVSSQEVREGRNALGKTTASS